MPDFGPYTVHYVAHPILSGRTRYVCNTTIIDNQLQSENHILVEDFQFGKKMDITDAYNLPVRLAVGLMKDKDGNIDLKVPVEGDLDDPEYKVWPIVWQVLKNLVVKAVTAPAALIGRALGADEDDLKAVRFLALQETIDPKQEKPLNTLTRVVTEKPTSRSNWCRPATARPRPRPAIRTAKAAYYVDSTGHPIDTAVADLDELLEGLDIRSPAFLAWMDAQAGPSDAPIQRRCMQLIGETNAATEVERLWAVRRDLVTNYLSVEKELPAGSFLVRDRLDTDTIPPWGQPSFHVLYGVRDEVATRSPRSPTRSPSNECMTASAARRAFRSVPPPACHPHLVHHRRDAMRLGPVQGGDRREEGHLTTRRGRSQQRIEAVQPAGVMVSFAVLSCGYRMSFHVL